MNLELLFWASMNGGPEEYFEMAVNHSDHTAKNHIRKAGNSWHLVDYDPDNGSVLGAYNTPQGLNSSNGTWARGQAWAVYGFTMAYRYTRYQRYLDMAQFVSDWFISHLPSDYVPIWDFAAPATDPKDSSAASIAASGLIELSSYLPGDKGSAYLQVAEKILMSLASPSYLADPTETDGTLLHGTGTFPNQQVNTSLVYGDYYFVEALLRYLVHNNQH